MRNRRRTSKHYRQPEDEELTKIFFLRYELEELFTEEEIVDFMSVARQSISGEFFFAVERNPRYKRGSNKRPFRGTENYIIGVGGRPSDLARYVTEKTHRQIVSTKCLPCHLTMLKPKLVERIVYAARYDIVLRTINAMMKNGEIRYDEGLGTWNVNQSNIDDFLDDRAFRKAIKRSLKVDDRNYHGAVRSQSKRRGRPEGVSVSFA